MKPSLCRMVIYRSRTGDYSLAAIVSAVRASLNRAGVDAGTLPDLPDDDHVHLVVFTPGLPLTSTPPHTAGIVDPSLPFGKRYLAAEPGTLPPEVEPPAFVAMMPFGGTYQEFAVPFWPAPEEPWELADQPAGTWTWPPRV